MSKSEGCRVASDFDMPTEAIVSGLLHVGQLEA